MPPILLLRCQLYAQKLPRLYVPPAVPQTSTRKIGRRQTIIGGVAAAALVAGGVATFAVLSKRGPAVSPPPQLGPRKLVAGVPVLSLNGHSSNVWLAKWHPTGRYLVTAGKDENIMLWDIDASLRKPPPDRIVTSPTRK